MRSHVPDVLKEKNVIFGIEHVHSTGCGQEIRIVGECCHDLYLALIIQLSVVQPEQHVVRLCRDIREALWLFGCWELYISLCTIQHSLAHTTVENLSGIRRVTGSRPQGRD